MPRSTFSVWRAGSMIIPLAHCVVSGKIALTAIEYEWASPQDYQIYRVPQPEEPSHARTPNEPRSVRSRVPQHFRPRRKNPRWFPRQSASEEQALSRRRKVYKDLTFSCHVGANRVSQFREFTPQTFMHSKELPLRAKKWIRRELQVFDFLIPSLDSETGNTQPRRYAGNTEFLLEYIISILRTTDLKDASGKAENMLAEFLGQDRARLFLHELSSWLRSPYTDLDAWDRHVQYPTTPRTDA